jgi:PTH2 family peptidyl-tRNA hydrolase
MKQVLVIRKDLNMRKGKIAAQAAHASLKATLANLYHPEVKAWLDSAFTKICVSVDSEEELQSIVDAAIADGLITAVITDSGRTEFNGVPTVTCAAVGPASEEQIDKITGHLKLL